MNRTLATAFVTRVTFAALFLLAAAAFLPANGQTCATDQAIVDAVYAKFQKNSQLSSQVSRLNFTVVREPVSGQMQAWKIEGWVDNEKDLDEVIKVMLSVYSEVNGLNCFGNIKFNQNSLYTASEVPPGLKSEGGCVGDTKPCGDICIPVSESCNISGRTK